MTQPSDSNIRQQALDTRHSFAVSAPAGSGKTGLLTQRVLALLGQCEQPENVLAITFTKKAAAEMQSRIFAALLKTQKQLEDGDPPPTNNYDLTTWELAKKVLERDQEYQWQLLSLPNRLKITTIDSFCRLLSQQMPLSNGMGNTPEMLDSADADHAYLMAIRETLKLVEKEHDIQHDIGVLIRHFNNQIFTIEELLIKLLKRRDQWLGSLYVAKNQRQRLESTLSLVVDSHLSSLREQTVLFSGELVELLDYAASNLARENSSSILCSCLGISELPAPNQNDIEKWQAIAELLLTDKGQVRKRVNIKQGFPPANKTSTKEEQLFSKQQKQRIEQLLNDISELPESSELIQALDLCRHLPNTDYSDQQWQLLDSLTRVLYLLVAQLTIIFQQLGKSDFISITLSALNALGDEDQPSDLALALDYRIQHILVDEFQDTSTPQLQLLKKLTAGWQANDGRTLFIVGDAMQSCYGFRDANVGIFLDLRANGLGHIELIPLDLTVNFRSQELIVNWCNTVFQSVFPPKNKINQGAVKYQTAEAYNPSTIDGGIETHLLVGDEKIKERSEEANIITDLIQKNQTKNPEDSIAVLVRKRSQVSQITQSLNQKGIAYRATELDKLDTNMLVMDLVNLTRALLYPNDRIAWLSLLRAPWCGLNMEDLYQVATTRINDDRTTIATLLLQYNNEITLSQPGRNILKRFIASINIILNHQKRDSLRNWIERAWLQLGGDALLLNKEEKYAVNAFFKCLAKYQRGGELPQWATFVKAISLLYNQSDMNINDTKIKSLIPPVEIMTIHKSKGLEFDTVIIPGIDLLPTSDKQELMVWLEWLDEEKERLLLISPVHATGEDQDSIYRYIRLQQKSKQQLESDRLFYVACTRAIKQLHLFGHSIKSSSNEELTKPNNDSALNCLWPYIIDTAIIYNFSEKLLHSTLENTDKHPNKIIRLVSEWEPPTVNENNLLKKYRLNNINDVLNKENIASSNELIQRHNRYFGKILHAAIELITQSGFKNWNCKRIQEQQYFWKKQLLQLGLNSSLADQYIEKLSQALEKMLESNIGQWLLDNKHKDSQCELALWSSHVSPAESGARELIIDRTFIGRIIDGTDQFRWIIDYKSSEPEAQESIDDFSQKEAELYRGQLLTYKALFQEQAEPIRCALYFPLIDHFYEIDTK